MQDKITIFDIKPIVDIYVQYSYILYIMLGLGIAVVVIFVIMFVRYRSFKNSDFYIYINKLKQLNLNNENTIKNVAYKISKYSHKITKTKEQKKLLDELNILLHRYKYKQEVGIFDDEIKNKFKSFLIKLENQNDK